MNKLEEALQFLLNVIKNGSLAAIQNEAMLAGRVLEEYRAALAAPDPVPIDMILYCPACGKQHVDAPDVGAKECVLDKWAADAVIKSWTNPPHRSHLCAGCGTIWRPADVPTNGVLHITTAGKNDSRRFSRNAVPAKEPT